MIPFCYAPSSSSIAGISDNLPCSSKNSMVPVGGGQNLAKLSVEWPLLVSTGGF